MNKIKVVINITIYKGANVTDSDYETAYVNREVSMGELEFGASSYELGQALMGHLDDEIHLVRENTGK